MTDLRKAAEMALEAFQSCRWDCDKNNEPHKTFNDILVSRASEALHAALAQPEQEPVAWLDEEMDMAYTVNEVADADGTDFIPLYTAPPSKPWVGLTDEERHSIREWQRIQEELGPVWAPMMLYLYEAIEAALKEKNT